jgi:hypothetical protein
MQGQSCVRRLRFWRGRRVRTAEAFLGFDPPMGLTPFDPPAQEGGFCHSQDYLPASVVGHCYLHLLGRGVAAAVGAGDGYRVDASIAAAFSLGSK